MKANHIPAPARITARLYKMRSRLSGAFVKRPGWFYPLCRHCDDTNVQVSIAGDHRSSCPLRGWEKQIRHYENLLSTYGAPS